MYSFAPKTQPMETFFSSKYLSLIFGWTATNCPERRDCNPKSNATKILREALLRKNDSCKRTTTMERGCKVERHKLQPLKVAVFHITPEEHSSENHWSKKIAPLRHWSERIRVIEERQPWSGACRVEKQKLLPLKVAVFHITPEEHISEKHQSKKIA